MNPAAERANPGIAKGVHPPPEVGPARLLFVDNSVVLRTALKDLFKQHDAIEAFTSSPAADVVLLNIAKTRPHLVVIDADGEWQDVSSLVAAIRSEQKSLSLVLITANAAGQDQLDQKGRAIGVSGCWFKSNNFRHPDASVRQYLVTQAQTVLRLPARAKSSVPDRVSSIAEKSSLPKGQSSLGGERKTNQSSLGGERKTKKSVIVIGVSTGGPDALSALLPLLPADLNVPVLIVQHTLAAFTSLLVERLQKRTALSVLEAQDGMPVVSGQILVAPGNRHMQLAVRNGQVVAVLDEGPPENSCRPAVDPLFRSAARVYGAHVLGIVLTGMGQDGLLGSRELRRAGATLIVQDQASSTVWGMPGQVAQAGLAHFVLDLKEIAGEIVRQIGTRPKARTQL